MVNFSRDLLVVDDFGGLKLDGDGLKRLWRLTQKHMAARSRWRAGGKQVQLPAEMKDEAQLVVRALSPAQKLRAAERLYYSARQLKAAALRAQHPDWSEETIRRSVREIFLYARS